MAVARLAAIAAVAVAATDQQALFIGNSFSFAHGGVWVQYATVAQKCVPSLHVLTIADAVAARTLSMATGGTAGRAVAEGRYDLLVLQDQSDLLLGSSDPIRSFFAPEARKHNATVGLYQTWAKPWEENFTSSTLLRVHAYAAYASAAREAGARVLTARAGEAFLEVLRRCCGGDTDDPSFTALYDADQEHPSELGVNLVAWVMTLAFNPAARSCDPSNVPLVPGQSTEQRREFFEVACELAGLCPPTKETSTQPLCGTASALQGTWERRRLSPEDGCREGKLPAPRCYTMEEWRVDGTDVQFSRGSPGTANLHTLRVRDYGSFCSVKLLPERAYVSLITREKVLFNDCSVWTRKGSSSPALPEECVCVKTDTWRDADGDSCSAYAEGHAKHSTASCDFGSGGIVSQTRSLLAWQACPGCGRCHLRLHADDALPQE